MKTTEIIFKNLFETWSGEALETVETLPQAGSNRTYHRLHGRSRTAIATVNDNLAENQTFIAFSQHFKACGVRVPEIYAADEAAGVYLQQDLGNVSLYQLLSENRIAQGEISAEVRSLYRKALEQLARVQLLGHKGLDYERWCFDAVAFDEQAMTWDLNYFKYYFLKISGLSFQESRLETDFRALVAFLDSANREAFMVRDFQARNLMIFEGEPYIIDYQGGRRGAMPYDVISLLYQAQAQLSDEVREELLEDYLTAAEALGDFRRADFLRFYTPFLLLRTLQVLGAYGFRGLYEKKPHFLSSIPFAINNLAVVLSKIKHSEDKSLNISYLTEVLERLVTHQNWNQYLPKGKKNTLTVTVSSFSYKKKGLPIDLSGNGGGFVFDCRGIENPGRYTPYKLLTGRDAPVIEFLETQTTMTDFVENAKKMVQPSIEDYLKRGFSSLMVSFGCTGGQHRSVYACEKMAAFLRQQYPIEVVVQHLEQNF